jgi:hypothetical protein
MRAVSRYSKVIWAQHGSCLLIALPPSDLYACIGGCLWRIGHNLHQFDRIPIGIVDPVLQIEI